MKYVVTLLVVCLGVAGKPVAQSNADVFSYRVLGKVVLKQDQSPSGATVYVMGTRPINGRIPWVHAAKDGTFSIEFSDAPDDFRVCAHSGETRGFLPLARPPEEAKTMPINQLWCTKDFRLDADHREKRVKLKLK